MAKHGKKPPGTKVEPIKGWRESLVRIVQAEVEASTDLMTFQFLADTWHLLLCMTTIWLAHYVFEKLFHPEPHVGSIGLFSMVDTGHFFALARWMLRNLKMVFR